MSMAPIGGDVAGIRGHASRYSSTARAVSEAVDMLQAVISASQQETSDAVEALAGSLWPGQLSAVSAIPDAKKGERLILLTDAPNATRAEFLAYAKSKNAMDIMVPAEVRVGKVPVLGSGKVDFVEARRLALEPVVSAAVA